MNTFTSENLPTAVASLFRLNHYEVEGPLMIHGAEIDLIARPLADPFGVNVYLEVTIEYVDNTKYGKDLTKLALIREKDPNARLVIISSQGFSLPVKERAQQSRFETYTYFELFNKFQKFSTYIELFSERSEKGKDLIELDKIYEEPDFSDNLGVEKATDFLTKWRESNHDNNQWLVVIGEYGTGKTALTRILQYRWLQDHTKDPSLPIPFRIELRDFVRQFDARGLIHHFLDNNGLSHLSIEFVESLIRTGRIILILDGYDEMAQYLHARERRACLEALAELSAGGAKGILTSRPNYFTEAEELQVFEILYASLKAGHYHLGKRDEKLLEQEQRVDRLLEKFIDRHERKIKDLTPEQTKALVGKALASDPVGRDAVMKVPSGVFRTVEGGDEISLSGKPVIISYLLEVVEGLSESLKSSSDRITEWQIYKLIVDQLMLRDLRRSPGISPESRRSFLQDLSIKLSREPGGFIDENNFKELVSKAFQQEIRRQSSQQRNEHLEKLFADLRSSTTLTRSGVNAVTGWRFSHNSLREYLAAERIINQLRKKEIPREMMVVSDAMQQFVGSKEINEISELTSCLADIWPQRQGSIGIGSFVSILWPAVLKNSLENQADLAISLQSFAGIPAALNDIEISRISLSSDEHPMNLNGANFSNSSLLVIDLGSADLTGANFSNALLEGVNLNGAGLSGSRFNGAILVDVTISDANLENADFRGVDSETLSFLVEQDNKLKMLRGLDALGYVNFYGAVTDHIDRGVVARHHPKFFITDKILSKLSEQNIRQKRGLTQRGAARHDIRFSHTFVEYLETRGLIRTPPARKDLLEITEVGRDRLKNFTDHGTLPLEVVEFLLDIYRKTNGTKGG